MNRTCPRRSFLKGALALPACLPGLPALFARAALAAPEGDRILVLVRLDGGNDGLNTVIPFGDDAYHRARPGLRVAPGKVLRLDHYEGLHPSLAALRGAWDAGQLAVLQGVGYPNPSLSHFTSSDIWNTAALDPRGRWSGWLGRALDRCAEESEVPGLQLDPGPLNRALVGECVVVPAVADARHFTVRGPRDLLEGLVVRLRAPDSLEEYVRKTAVQAYRTSARIERALQGRSAAADAYPASPLGGELWQVARLIEAGLPARVYGVRLSGFDTHARQAGAHAQLLQILGDALAAFQADLDRRGLAGRVLTMTYSEFGRRVRENRSLGTDHGKAAPMFVLGGAIRGGLHGAHPSLTDLDDGDLRWHTDFRQVYATVLDRWLGVDADAVLGARFERLRFL